MLEIDAQASRSFAENFEKSPNPQKMWKLVLNFRRVKIPIPTRRVAAPADDARELDHGAGV